MDTWRGHGFIQLPLSRQTHYPNLTRTTIAPLREREREREREGRERGLASAAALHQTSIAIRFHRWTPQLYDRWRHAADVFLNRSRIYSEKTKQSMD